MTREECAFLFRLYFKEARFFGFRYESPICNSHLRLLRPDGLRHPVLTEKNIIGGGHRENAWCPTSHSLDRERLLYLYLRRRANLFSEKLKVLHVAPEKAVSRILKMRPNIDDLTADARG